MGNVKSIGSNSQSRRFLSAIHTSSLKTGILSIKKVAQARAMRSEDAIPAPLALKARHQIRAQNQTLLNITDTQSMLTTVEDSLETIMDVLGEMKSLAADAGAIQDGTVYEKPQGNGFMGWINGNRDENKDLSALRTAYKDRLTELSREIDDVIEDTSFYGKRLLGDRKSSFSFFVNFKRDDTLEVTFEPLSAADLSVAADDIRVSNNDAAGATLAKIDDAMTHVQDRLDHLVNVKDRLTIKYDTLKTARSIHNAAVTDVNDPDSARKELELTKLRIIEESNMAMLAQANATTHAAMRLTENVHQDDDLGPFARIYSIDSDRDSTPVTHLRRIMLGQGSERPEFATFSDSDA